MQTISRGPVYSCQDFEKVPYVDSLVVLNDSNNELVFFAVNRDEVKEQMVSLQVQGLILNSVIDSISMTAEDKKMNNKNVPDAVKPKINNKVKLNNEKIDIILAPLSFNVVRISVE